MVDLILETSRVVRQPPFKIFLAAFSEGKNSDKAADEARYFHRQWLVEDFIHRKVRKFCRSILREQKK